MARLYHLLLLCFSGNTVIPLERRPGGGSQDLQEGHRVWRRVTGITHVTFTMIWGSQDMHAHM